MRRTFLAALLLSGILLIHFDATVAQTVLTAGVSRNCNLPQLEAQPAVPQNQVQYLYCLFLGRAADAGGLNFYTTQLTSGALTLHGLMDVIFTSAEFSSDYNIKRLTPTQLTTLMYNVFLFRQPDPSGLAYYVGQLQSGALTPVGLMKVWDSSAEFQAKNRILSGVDPNTLEGKFMFGYQGWFTSHLDDDPYSEPNNTDAHWAAWGAGAMSPTNATVDMWPDTTAYPSYLLHPTDFRLPNGNTAMVYSAWDQGTVNLHFQWMQQYGLDGAVLQEFVQNYLNDSTALQVEIDQVALNVAAAAEQYGRVFYVELDCSACTTNNVVQSVETRWEHLVDNLKLTQSPAYLHHKGLPVVTLYGFGINAGSTTIATPQQVEELITWFHSGAPPQYRATIVGQTCVGWRTNGQGCLADPAWTRVYNEYDVIQPWYVGAWTDIPGADSNWNSVIKGDIDQTKANGQGYMPTLWPGTSVSNLKRTQGISGYSLNQIPRLGGQFWWRQLYNYLGSDPNHKISMAYGAMFDEVDEGTAMYKLAATANAVPHQAPSGFVYLDMPDSNSTSGYNLPSDWYLELANCGTLALHGTFVPTNTIPASGTAPGCQSP